MPDMNSYHFLQHVTHQIRIPVIMMCFDQSTTPSLVMKAIEKGACGYWIKPLSEGQIKNIWQHVVRKVLKENNQHDQVLEILNVLKKKEGKEVSSQPSISKPKKLFSVIEAVASSRKRVLLPKKNIRNSLQFSSELHRTLHGFIVFEVAWNNVRGINYFNELQTDTSLAIEAKLMKRWEFDNIAQSASCMSSWFSGTLSEQLLLKEHLDSSSGEIFYDASRILLSGDLSERQALVEAEGISSDVSKNTTTQSPFEFCNVLQKGNKRLGLKAFGETFKVIGNPLKPILNLRRNIALHHHSPDNPSILFRKGFTHQSQRQFIPTSKFRVIRVVAIPLEPDPVESAEYRKELAECFGFNQIGEPLPETVTLKDIITSLPKKVFEIDDVKAWKTVLISTTSYALGLLMISKAPWYLLPLGWAWTGTAVTGFFVIGHDCAHKSFLTNKLVEYIVGTLAFLPPIYPYEPWRFKYDKHHAKMNMLKEDTAWQPVWKDEFESNPLLRKAIINGYGPFRCWMSIAHLLVVHFDLTRFRPNETNREKISLACVFAFTAIGWPSIIYKTGIMRWSSQR
ncbi:hypothetical protein RYX36_021658 [Vicia faba]